MSVSGVSSLDTIYSLRADQANSTTMYVGEASIGALESAPIWRIKKLVTSGTLIALYWADGNKNFDNVWADRATLTYT